MLRKKLHERRAIEAENAEKHDEKNKAKFVGPKGEVAQDMPDAGRGRNVVDSPKQMRRNLPQQHGGASGEHAEGGLRGDRRISDAARHGGRGKN